MISAIAYGTRAAARRFQAGVGQLSALSHRIFFRRLKPARWQPRRLRRFVLFLALDQMLRHRPEQEGRRVIAHARGGRFVRTMIMPFAMFAARAPLMAFVLLLLFVPLGLLVSVWL